MQDEKGNKSLRRAAHVKVCEPVDKVINQLPPQSVYEQYGRRSKLVIHPKDVPEISLQLFNKQQQEERSEDPVVDKGVEVIDESRSRETVSDKGMEQCVSSSNFITLATPIDHIDELSSQDKDVMQEESQQEQFEVNTLTVDWTSKSVNCDESRSQLQVSTVQKIRDIDSQGKLKMSSMNTSSDDSDESSCQMHKPVWLGDASDESRSRVYCIRRGPRCSRSDDEMEANVDSDESNSRATRCSMSNLQQREQPVTPVIQSECVESTRVNIRNIDECPVTNKCECSKQGSKQMSKQWLSNTFSIITSGFLGKSKVKTREEVMENVDTTEFNFFL